MIKTAERDTSTYAYATHTYSGVIARNQTGQASLMGKRKGASQVPATDASTGTIKGAKVHNGCHRAEQAATVMCYRPNCGRVLGRIVTVEI